MIHFIFHLTVTSTRQIPDSFTQIPDSTMVEIYSSVDPYTGRCKSLWHGSMLDRTLLAIQHSVTKLLHGAMRVPFQSGITDVHPALQSVQWEC